MKTRKIAHVPALSGLYAMPAKYDAVAVTRDDATHDAAICGARAELDFLRGSSLQAQEMARDTIDSFATTRPEDEEDAARMRERDASDRIEAQEALDALETAWRDALRAADSGDVTALRGALEDAQRIEREWGDSSQSGAALRMLDFGAEAA